MILPFIVVMGFVAGWLIWRAQRAVSPAILAAAVVPLIAHLAAQAVWTALLGRQDYEEVGAMPVLGLAAFLVLAATLAIIRIYARMNRNRPQASARNE